MGRDQGVNQMSYAIYRDKLTNKIRKVQKNHDDIYSPEKLEELREDFNKNPTNDRVVSIVDNDLIGEILDYLDETEQLQDNWKSAIKKDLLENIGRAQSELNDLEMFVHNFGAK